MPLETVELVVEIGNAFGVMLLDDLAEEIETVGQCYRRVLERLDSDRLDESSSPVPLGAVTFYKVRRGLMEEFGVPRKSVRLNTSLDELLPREGRYKHWERFRGSLDLDLPPLHRPRWMRRVLTGYLTLYPIVLGLYFILDSEGKLYRTSFSFHTVLNLWTVGPLLAWGAFVLSESLAIHLPADCGTVRGLVERALLDEYRRLPGRNVTLPPLDVWRSLQAIVVAHLEVGVEQVTEEARFVEDLGCA